MAKQLIAAQLTLPLELVSWPHSPVETISSAALPDEHLAASKAQPLLYVWPSEAHTGA